MTEENPNPKLTSTPDRPIKTNYPSNKKVVDPSEPENREKQEKAISGKVVKRKKSVGRKLAETFAGDDIQSVGDYILFDVFVPAAKAMISDATSQGIERLLFGEAARRGPAKTGMRTNYNSYSRPNERRVEPEPRRDISRRGRSTHDFDEIVLETRAEADLIIERLQDLISTYDTATVSDLYDLIGITGNFTDDKWGWTGGDLRQAGCTRIRQGYLLDIPRPKPLD